MYDKREHLPLSDQRNFARQQMSELPNQPSASYYQQWATTTTPSLGAELFNRRKSSERLNFSMGSSNVRASIMRRNIVVRI
jgi:hypothetical protein